MAVKFNESELKVAEISKSIRGAQVPVFTYPITMKEGYKKAILEKKPEWITTGIETFGFTPDIIPDNRARGFLNDAGVKLTDEEKGGYDMFGVHWTYVPTVGGSMETPGQGEKFSDVNDWKENLVFPDIESWDWEACAERNKEMLEAHKDQFISMQFLNGFGFERLISFMGFEDAAVALIDEDQADALHELLDATSDLYCELIKKCVQYFHVDGFVVHDDWGSQRAPFFSVEAGREFLVPAMKKVTDLCHSLGVTAELHSCGCNETQIGNYIAAGWDSWGPMANINDTMKLFDEYGDQIVIGVMPPKYDVATATEEEIRAIAKAFVEHVTADPKKVCSINRHYGPWMTSTFCEELYKCAREVYQDR